MLGPGVGSGRLAALTSGGGNGTLKHATFLAVFALAAALATTPARAADPGTIEGTWEGFLRPNPVLEIRWVLRVEKSREGTFKATAQTPDFKPTDRVPFELIPPPDGSGEYVLRAGSQEIRGKLDAAGTGLAGTWKQRTTTVPLAFTKLAGEPAPWEVWEGPIELPGGISLRVVFHVGPTVDGKTLATMDSPDQGSNGIKVDAAGRDKESLTLAIKAIKGEFAGKFDSTGTTVAGTWKQAGASSPLTLKKVEKVSEVRRTQALKPPFPYRVEEVAYDSKAPGVRIAGTLTIPAGPGPFPAALLISGSGPQDRDETLLGHKPFQVLADALTRRGVAVLRVDDRGTAGSTGDFSKATSFDFADDAEAGFEFLRARKEVAPGRIGLIGHSEGGLIAPIVAARTPEVGFIVLLAGPGLPGDQILVAQQALILKAVGAKDEDIKKSTDALARMVAVAKDEADPKAAERKLKAIRDEVAATLPEAERKALADSDPQGAAVARLATPWMRTFLAYDPRPTLAKVRCPVLALNGANDLQVPCRDNLDAIAQALATGGNTRATTRALPGLNHLFQPSATGAPSEYGKIEETFSPEALAAIADWVAAQGASR